MKKFLWILFIIVSLGLLGGYLVGETHEEAINPLLKGLTLLQHFGIHYVVGIFFGLIILIAYTLITQKRLNESLLLTISVLWSHWPDIRFAYRKLPHEPWEAIFFFHTLVDEAFILFWILLVVNAILIVLYRKITKRA